MNVELAETKHNGPAIINKTTRINQLTLTTIHLIRSAAVYKL